MSNKYKIGFIGILLSLLLTGCGSHGNENMRNETTESVSQKITENVTTKPQIKSTFGAPDSTSFTDSGLEIWKYTFTKSTAKGVNYIPIVNAFAAGTNDQKKELIILFDVNNIVKKYTFSETEGETRTGIFAK